MTDPINSDVLADIDTVRVALGHAYRNLGIRPNASFPDFEALERVRKYVVDRPMITTANELRRALSCKCHLEEGDSPCPVHGEEE